MPNKELAAAKTLDDLAYSRWLLKKLIEWRTARAEYCDFDEWLKAQVTGDGR